MALLAALAYAVSTVLVRKKLDESNFISVAFVVAVTGNIILWPLALLFTNLRTVNLEAVLFFAIAGIFSLGIVNLLYYKSMEVVGTSLTASIFATSLVYSSIFAVFLLGEIIAAENWIGIVSILLGIVFIERGLSKPKTGPKKSLIKV